MSQAFPPTFEVEIAFLLSRLKSPSVLFTKIGLSNSLRNSGLWSWHKEIKFYSDAPDSVHMENRYMDEKDVHAASECKR